MHYPANDSERRLSPPTPAGGTTSNRSRRALTIAAALGAATLGVATATTVAACGEDREGGSVENIGGATTGTTPATTGATTAPSTTAPTDTTETEATGATTAPEGTDTP